MDAGIASSAGFLYLGFITICAGMLVIAATPERTLPAIATIAVGSAFVGFGLVLLGVLSTLIAAEDVRATEHGLNGGVLITTQQMGVAVGLGLLTAGAALPWDNTRESLVVGAVVAAAGLLTLERVDRRRPVGSAMTAPSADQ